ncbi:MAG: hypothetical protein IJM57_02130 [Lachnospiraceae bacterium]|nr:hypothetical protein [Lachnospiraceae bacterium]
MVYDDEPIVIKNVSIPKSETVGELGVPLTIAGLAGIVISVFLPYVTARSGVNSGSTLTSWDVVDVSDIGFLTKYFFMVFALLAVAAVWKQSGKLLVACCCYWIVNFLFCVSNARSSEALFAGSHPAITESSSVFEYSMGLGFYVYVIAMVVFVAGTVFYCKENAEG